MLNAAEILSSSRPSNARLVILSERNASKHSLADLERYAAISSGWVREMWLGAVELKRGERTVVPFQPVCSVWTDKHKVVYICERGTADIFRCACGEERFNARDAFSPECDYVIVEPDEEAELLETLPAKSSLPPTTES